MSHIKRFQAESRSRCAESLRHVRLQEYAGFNGDREEIAGGRQKKPQTTARAPLALLSGSIRRSLPGSRCSTR